MTQKIENAAPNSFTCLPGAQPFASSLRSKLEEKLTSLAGKSKPRTRHLNPDGCARFVNRLLLETSPYLLQHAHNPVNWYSWGDEAFQHARETKRPLLVSIGYSTCHWCHVMEEESFEDLEIAEVLNRHYVCIKVDREERPDIDAIYMTAVQATTGSGGWPLNVTVTPDRKPFWAGTYFPARDGDRGAMIGFLTLLQRIYQVYTQSHQEIERSSSQLSEAMERFLSPPPGQGTPGIHILDDAVDMYKKAYDPIHGGLNGAPKFPSSLPLTFLLRYYARTKQAEVLEMVTFSLRKMAAGGIYDQVGGGFHRYSTDEAWLVPHFEKMLYDNALLVAEYVDAYQATGEESFKTSAVEVLDYVLREMRSESGAFFSATDADSITAEGRQEEGTFFTWTPNELSKVLNEKQLALASRIWGITEKGNFEGRTVLQRKDDLQDLPGILGLDPGTFLSELQSIKEILYQERQKRQPPLRDEKIITSWNGLMISAFARAGAVFGNPRFISAAEQAAGFIQNRMLNQGRLYRTCKDNEVKHEGFLSDYANYTSACLDLFQATQEESWLRLALELDSVLSARFEDTDHGGFYRTASDQEFLITREKPISDGALPSGNAIAMNNLLRLHMLTLDDRFRQRFDKALTCFLGEEVSGLASFSETLAALELSVQKPVEIVIVEGEQGGGERYLRELHRHFLPQAQVVVVSREKENRWLQTVIPFLKERPAIDGKTTVYICQQGSCQRPVNDPASFSAQLDQLSGHS